MARRVVEICRSIERYTIDRVTSGDGHERFAGAVLLKRLTDLVALDDASPSIIDGYPTKTPGAGPPPATVIRFDDDGNVIERDTDDDGDDTIVESSVLARMSHGQQVDAIHRARLAAERIAQRIGIDLGQLATALDRADNLRSIAPIGTTYCHVAQVIYRLPFDEVWKIHVRTTFKGQLKPAFPEDRPVCRWVYDFVREWKRLPTEGEMRQRLEREVVRVSA